MATGVSADGGTADRAAAYLNELFEEVGVLPARTRPSLDRAASILAEGHGLLRDAGCTGPSLDADGSLIDNMDDLLQIIGGDPAKVASLSNSFATADSGGGEVQPGTPVPADMPVQPPVRVPVPADQDCMQPAEAAAAAAAAAAAGERPPSNPDEGARPPRRESVSAPSEGRGSAGRRSAADIARELNFAVELRARKLLAPPISPQRRGPGPAATGPEQEEGGPGPAGRGPGPTDGVPGPHGANCGPADPASYHSCLPRQLAAENKQATPPAEKQGRVEVPSIAENADNSTQDSGDDVDLEGSAFCMRSGPTVCVAEADLLQLDPKPSGPAVFPPPSMIPRPSLRTRTSILLEEGRELKSSGRGRGGEGRRRLFGVAEAPSAKAAAAPLAKAAEQPAAAPAAAALFAAVAAAPPPPPAAAPPPAAPFRAPTTTPKRIAGPLRPPARAGPGPATPPQVPCTDFRRSSARQDPRGSCARTPSQQPFSGKSRVEGRAAARTAATAAGGRRRSISQAPAGRSAVPQGSASFGGRARGDAVGGAGGCAATPLSSVPWTRSPGVCGGSKLRGAEFVPDLHLPHGLRSLDLDPALGGPQGCRSKKDAAILLNVFLRQQDCPDVPDYKAIAMEPSLAFFNAALACLMSCTGWRPPPSNGKEDLRASQDRIIRFFKDLGYPSSIGRSTLLLPASPATWGQHLCALAWVCVLLTLYRSSAFPAPRAPASKSAESTPRAEDGGAASPIQALYRKLHATFASSDVRAEAEVERLAQEAALKRRRLNQSKADAAEEARAAAERRFRASEAKAAERRQLRADCQDMQHKKAELEESCAAKEGSLKDAVKESEALSRRVANLKKDVEAKEAELESLQERLRRQGVTSEELAQKRKEIVDAENLCRVMRQDAVKVAAQIDAAETALRDTGLPNLRNTLDTFVQVAPPDLLRHHSSQQLQNSVERLLATDATAKLLLNEILVCPAEAAPGSFSTDGLAPSDGAGLPLENQRAPAETSPERPAAAELQRRIAQVQATAAGHRDALAKCKARQDELALAANRIKAETASRKDAAQREGAQLQRVAEISRGLEAEAAQLSSAEDEAAQRVELQRLKADCAATEADLARLSRDAANARANAAAREAAAAEELARIAAVRERVFAEIRDTLAKGCEEVAAAERAVPVLGHS